MSVPAAVNVKPVIPGDDYPLVFTFTNDDGSAEDQTGASLRVVVKQKLSDADADALDDFTVLASSPDAEAGVIRTFLPRASTRDYQQRGYVYVQARRVFEGLYQTPLLARLEVLDSVIDVD